MQIITLTNGKRVGNFSSPHPFVFEDGSILPAVSNEDAERLKVDFIEKPCEGGKPGDILLDFNLTPEVYREINDWIGLHIQDKIDIVFIPMPMLVAMRQEFDEYALRKWPFRVIRMTDRIKKLVSIEKQCL